MFLSLLLTSFTLAIPNEVIIDRLVQPCGAWMAPPNGVTVTERLSNPEIILMRYASRGLFESHDRGASWLPVTPPHMCMLPVTTFFNPQPEVGEPWCIGTLGEESSADAIFCSTDRGGTFTRLPYRLPTPFSSIRAFLVNPAQPRKMLLHVTQAYGGDVLLHSKDGGINWQTWKFPGLKRGHANLEAYLADGTVLAVIQGDSRHSKGKRLVRYKPASRGDTVVDVEGPWPKDKIPSIQVDAVRSNHWIAEIYDGKGGAMSKTVYESFNSGADFVRLADHGQSIELPSLLADGGIVYISDTEDGEQTLRLRRGKDGDFIQIPLPEPLLWLNHSVGVAANTIFFSGALATYRLDEVGSASYAVWRRIVPEVAP